MPRVFISFASADLDAAQAIADSLTAVGLEPFLDRDLVAGLHLGEEWRTDPGARLRHHRARVHLGRGQPAVRCRGRKHDPLGRR